MHSSAIESLEARIAPAVTIVNHPFDIVAGIGKTGATIDLGVMVDASTSYRTLVEFTTNYILPGTTTPAKIVLELFDDKAPLTVQNFLSYVNGKSGANYDGTFFHRIFDFQTNNGTDIIQAGGFDVSNIRKHIPTGPELHNEYDESDPELQNVRGTISMAKTAVSPNTATSEWFINLSDNSSTLGANNNGGFTVFGAIREGFEVIDAIGAAKKINAGGALTDLAVQDNYVSGTPKAKHLFEIVNAEVIAPTIADATGYDFGNIKVYDHGTSTISTLVDADLGSDNQLLLTYAAGATGMVDISIDVTKGAETVTEVFTVTIKPNLVTQLTSHNLPLHYVSGDKGVAKVKITNNAGGAAIGTGEVQLYLSEAIPLGNGFDPKTFLIDPEDQMFETKTIPLNLAGGQSMAVTVNFTIQDSENGIVLKDGKQYVVIARAIGTIGGATDQLFADDDDNYIRTGNFYHKSFGVVGDRKNVVTTIEGPNGTPLSFKLTGGGTGSFTVDSAGNIDISASGTGLSSVLSVKTVAPGEYIDDVTLNSPMGSVKFGAIDLHGHFAATAGVKSITLGNLGDPDADLDKDITINVFPNSTQKVSLVFGDVHDYTLISNMPVGKITAKSWLNDEAATASNQLFVESLDLLQIAGDLEATLDVFSDRKVGNITVGGTFRDASIKSLGDIGVIKLGNISGASIFAGLETAVPDVQEILEVNRLIGSLTVTGSVADSVIVAARFNSIVLGSVDGVAGTVEKGIYADAIKSYLRKSVPSLKLTKLDVATPVDAPLDEQGNYAVHVF